MITKTLLKIVLVKILITIVIAANGELTFENKEPEYLSNLKSRIRSVFCKVTVFKGEKDVQKYLDDIQQRIQDNMKELKKDHSPENEIEGNGFIQKKRLLEGNTVNKEETIDSQNNTNDEIHTLVISCMLPQELRSEIFDFSGVCSKQQSSLALEYFDATGEIKKGSSSLAFDNKQEESMMYYLQPIPLNKDNRIAFDESNCTITLKSVRKMVVSFVLMFYLALKA